MEPYDYVLIFKILIFQRYQNVLDGKIDCQINKRMSFMYFLNLTIQDDILESKTLWNSREQLIDLILLVQ
jgi:IS5 family transposase